MSEWTRPCRINVKLLLTLLAAVCLLGAGAIAGHQVRKRMIAGAALKKGRAALARQDWQTACKQLRRYLSKYPDDLTVLKQYAEARLSVRPLELPNIGAAIGAYRRALRLDPHDAATYKRLVALYQATRNSSELAHVAQKRRQNAPDDPQATIWLATALILQHKLPEARRELERLVDRLAEQERQHQPFVEACAWLAYIAAQERSSAAGQRALAWLDKAIQHAPESAKALVERARLYRQRAAASASPQARDADLARARQDLQRATALEPADPRTRLALSREWMEHGELDRAAAELEATAQLDPAALKEYFLDPDDWSLLKFKQAAELALRRRDHAEGVRLADQALRPHDPSRATLKYARQRRKALPAAVRLYVLGRRVEQARLCLREYTEALATAELTPDQQQQLALLKANVARAGGEPYEVIDVLQPIVTRNDALPGAWRLLAEAFDRTDQPRRAVRALLQYLRLRPTDAAMAFELARHYVELGDWRRALDAARLAQSLRPADVRIQLLRLEASLHVAAEQSEAAAKTTLAEASAELARLRKAHPGRVEVRLLQAMIAARQGRRRQAEQELRRASAECDDPLPAELQLARFYYNARRTDQALEVARAACERHAELAEPWIAAAALLRGRQRYAEARQTLRAGLESVTDARQKRDLTIALALLEIVHGERQAGIDLLKALAAADERDVRVRALLLELPEVRADRSYALQLVEQLRQIERPTGLLWRLYQAGVWLYSPEWRAKQHQIAELLSFCLTADPQWPAPVLLLGRMYEWLGDSSRAREIYRRAIRQNPAGAEVADRLLDLLDREGRFPEAKELLGHLRLHPRALAARRIAIAVHAGEFAEAIDELKLRVASDPNDADARILLARLVYLQDKDLDAALHYLDQAEALAPDALTAVAARVWLLRSENRLEQARKLLDDLVARRGTFRAYFLRAQYLADTGELELAEQDYRELARRGNGGQGCQLLGQFYLDSDRLEQAIAAWEEGCRRFPHNLALQRSLMKALLTRSRGDDRRRAQALLTELTGRLPGDPDLLWVRALLALDEHTPAATRKARQLLQQVVQKEPTHVAAYLALIDIARRQGDFAAARDLAITALGASPARPELLLARAWAELDLDKPRAAWNLAQLLLSSDQRNADAQKLLLAAALKTGNPTTLAATRDLLDKAISAHPADGLLQAGRARVLHALGQTDEALAGLQAYCRTAPGQRNVNALVTLADLYRLRGDFDAARKEIQAAAALAPASPLVLRARLAWLADRKELDRVVALVREQLSGRVKDPSILMTAGSILAASDQPPHRELARTLFEQAAAAAPWLAEAQISLATLAYQAGDVARAEAAYRAVLSRQPANAPALNDLAWILAQQRRQDPAALQQALELADRAVALEPENVHFLDTRGLVLSCLPGRLPEARRDLEKCLRLSAADSPQRAKALLKLGRVCAKLGAAADARRYLARAAALDQRQQVFSADERRQLQELLRNVRPD